MVHLHYQQLGGSSIGISHNATMTYYKVHGGNCSYDNRNQLFSANNFPQTIMMIIVRHLIYILWLMKKIDHKVTIFYPSLTFGRVRLGSECCMLTWGLSHFQTSIPQALNHLQKDYWNTFQNMFTDHVSNMINTHQITLSALSSKRNYSMRTDSRLTINKISLYWSKMGYNMMGFYHLQNGINPSHHGSTSVGHPTSHCCASQLWLTRTQWTWCTTTWRFT